MSTLSAVWKRVIGDAKPQSPRAASPPAADRFLLLAQLGGVSFQLLTFPEIESMQEYATTHFVDPRWEGIIALELIDSWPARKAGRAPEGGAEAVAILRDADRPEIVQLYSFIDMAAAQSFAGERVGEGVDSSLVLLHWASRVTLDAPIEEPATTATRGLPYRAPGGRAPASSAARRSPRGTATAKAEAVRPAPDSVWRGLYARMLAASLLKEDIFKDLEQDPLASRRAALIVCLGALALGIGFVMGGPASAVLHVFGGVAAWAAFATTVYVTGTSVMGAAPVSRERYFQVVGLASSPAVIFALGVLPIYGPLFVLAASLWIGAATAVALTPAFGWDRGYAFIATATGWVVYFGVALVLPAFLT